MGDVDVLIFEKLRETEGWKLADDFSPPVFIADAHHVGGHRLDVLFSDGARRRVDMSRLVFFISPVLYGPLQNIATFEKFKVTPLAVVGQRSPVGLHIAARVADLPYPFQLWPYTAGLMRVIWRVMRSKCIRRAGPQSHQST